jgi:putative ABC transport system ATP-binding protein
LADEPTAELDAASAQQVASLIDELAANEGTVVLMVSHDPAMELGTRRVVRMRDGRIVEERRDGHASLVIGADGWVQLPRPLLEQSGIGRRARAAAFSRTGLLLTPAARGPAATGPTGPPPPQAALPSVPAPVRVQLERVWRWRGEGAGRQAVIADLSTEFEAGCLTAVTGRSGSGKTTLLELLACLERPAAGQVWIDDEPLAAAGRERLAEVRRRLIGYLPQEPAPVGFLSATENVVLALQIRGVRGEPAARQAEAVLGRVGLADRRRQRVARLSAGEAQRLALARALACAQGVLVVDEPTSRLDAEAAAGVAELLCGAARQGQAVICATHDPRLIQVADRVLELERLNSRSLPPPPSSAILSSPTTAEEPA